jgi:hypothetical protein
MWLKTLPMAPPIPPNRPPISKPKSIELLLKKIITPSRDGVN